MTDLNETYVKMLKEKNLEIVELKQEVRRLKSNYDVMVKCWKRDDALLRELKSKVKKLEAR